MARATKAKLPGIFRRSAHAGRGKQLASERGYAAAISDVQFGQRTALMGMAVMQ